jgi:hypothetical protein
MSREARDCSLFGDTVIARTGERGWQSMYESMALVYGLLTSFVLTSASHSRRIGRPVNQKVALIGWSLASASITLGVILLGYALLTF